MGEWRIYWIDTHGSVTTPGQAKIIEDSMREVSEVGISIDGAGRIVEDKPVEVRERLVSGRDVLERLWREAMERAAAPDDFSIIWATYDMEKRRAWRHIAAELYTLLAAPWFEEGSQ